MGESRALRVLGALITEANTRDVVSEGRLRTLTDLEQSMLRSTLTLLETSRLVRRTEQRSIAFWEITSEYLIAPITQAAAKAAQREKTAQAERKAAQGRLLASAKVAEATRYRTMAQVATLLTVITVALLAVAAYYYVKTRETSREAERLAARLVELQTTVLRKDAELEIARARTEQLQRELSTKPWSILPTDAFASANVLIGFSAIMLVFGIGVAGLTGGISALLNLRGRYLREALTDLLIELDPALTPALATRIASRILHHAMIRDPFGRAGASDHPRTADSHHARTGGRKQDGGTGGRRIRASPAAASSRIVESPTLVARCRRCSIPSCTRVLLSRSPMNSRHGSIFGSIEWSRAPASAS